MSIWDQLQNPPVQYRSVPLWSWNDKLETEELERQIEEMHKAGIGGFFMHARGGLLTPYMGKEWMSAVRTCIEKSKELGMTPWLYDENGWPSGFADGKVPALGIAYQQKRLAYEQAPFQNPAERTIGFYAKSEHGYRLLSAADESGADLRFFYEVNPYYIDTLSVETVRAFIETTYEAYWERFGEEFGDDLKGVFTDEPQFARGHLPWSFDLEHAFESRYGYDLKEALPALFMNVEGASKARYDYWECVTAMFTQSYAKQIGDWCDSKGWSATGHVVDEQVLMQQVTSVGDPMAFYEYLQIPGCDWLGRFISEEPIVPKQVGSVAHQLGKKMTITESFGCSGWNVSFEDLKRIGEWQFVHGINLMCQHLQGYTLRGLRKRDYPPSLFYQQPWWEDYKAFNDYFARLSMLLSEGTRQPEVLLLHPIRSAWVHQCGEDSSGIEPYHQAFSQLSRLMCQTFVEHDYGSESIIERHGSVSNSTFIIGEAAYRVVIIPPSTTLNRVTVDLLKQFVLQGGSLVAFAPFPTLINGQLDKELDQLVESALKPEWKSSALLNALSSTVSPSSRMLDHAGEAITEDTMNVQTLALDGAMMYYFVNSGKERYESVQVELFRKGKVSLIDLETGGVTPIEQEDTDRGVRIRLTIHPGQSYVVKIVPEEAAQSEEMFDIHRTTSRQPESKIFLDHTWKISKSEENSLTLDTCRLRVEGGAWSEPQPVVFIQELLLAFGRPVHIELEFEFQVAFDVDLSRELYVVLEKPEDIKIELNGRQVESISAGWWRDISFQKVDIRGMIVPGANRIRLKSYFYNSSKTYEAIEHARQFESEGNKLTFETEIENIYIIGSFGVESSSPYLNGERHAVHTMGPFVLMELPVSVHTGDLVSQGFPFYSGKMHLQQKVYVDRNDWLEAKWSFSTPPDTIVSRLYINGQEVRTFLWEPYEADITSFLRKGDNLIEVEMANSCRNLLGPHHHIKGELYKVGPDSFTDKPGWTDKNIDKNTCIYTDRYTFVRFGLDVSPYIEMK
ncbi:glycosyl hydrolase [Paenibacillus andongensis]|uniref:glycosyl hydrolase n=1 Tax=Paenibacillus andongensis TaxID=2975482 RepID=UPI0021BB0759|nr:glycosyl hydrolase [Paenibacillus andongensis]